MTDSQLADVVATQAKAQSFAGVVRISTPAEVLVNHAAGEADRANARAITAATRFATASGTKIFTAVACARLVADGRLTFETSLGELLGSELGAIDPDITVAQLLTHTAGNADYFDEEVMDDYGALWVDRPTYSMRRPADFLALFADAPAKFTRGERFSYNNSGFVLLGLVIEAASGREYIDYVTESVLKPAGMTRSGFFAFESLPGDCALGYLDDASLMTNIFSVPAIGGADGGMWTTAEDMEKFWRALVDGALLPSVQRDAMLTVHTPAEDADQYCGYGVFISGEGEQRAFYVVGEDPGVSMVSAITPATGVVMTILASTDSGAWPMSAAVRDELANARTP